MIDLVIRNRVAAYTASLTASKFVLQSDIWQLGVRSGFSDIPLTDNKEDDVQVSLCSDNDVGKHLLKLLTEKHTLEDAYKTVQIVGHAHDSLKEALQIKIIGDRYSSIEELFQDIQDMTEELGSSIEHFYFPLQGCLEEDMDTTELDGSDLLPYESEIQEQIEREQEIEYTNMAEYYWGNKAMKEKLVSAIWSVKRMGNELYGCVEARATSAFTHQEREDFKDWVLGQNSDGLGEGFEQRAIQTEDGELYVSFWNIGQDYKIYNSNEMEAILDDQNCWQMGGM